MAVFMFLDFAMAEDRADIAVPGGTRPLAIGSRINVRSPQVCRKWRQVVQKFSGFCPRRAAQKNNCLKSMDYKYAAGGIAAARAAGKIGRERASPGARLPHRTP
ncbi:MAG: hypothetical protein ACK4N4_15885 [Burkholderiales bacterium]